MAPCIIQLKTLETTGASQLTRYNNHICKIVYGGYILICLPMIFEQINDKNFTNLVHGEILIEICSNSKNKLFLV